MTLTILASVSLLALVSSARPLPKPEESWKSLQRSGSGEDADIQQAIQAVVRSHASFSEDLEAGDDVYVQLASIEEVQAYLSSAEGDAIKALIPLDQDELHSPDEKELHELLNRLENQRGGRSPVPDEVLDSMSIASPSSISQFVELPSEVTGSESDMISATELFASKPVVVMVASCVIVLLTVCCIGAVLYIVETLRQSIFRSAWDILPHLEKNAIAPSGRKDGVTHYACEAIEGGTEKMPGALTVTTHLLRMPFSASLHEVDSDASNIEDGVDEKFFDAESPDLDDSPYTSPKSAPVDLPPGLPAIAAATATIAAVAVVQPPEMREIAEPEPPIASADVRPSWSVRAAEAGALVHAHNSQDHDEQRRRRGMFAMPELDAALAMQLRPGLGIGADAAWLVRFVMALFGWCAVLMSGGGRRR